MSIMGHRIKIMSYSIFRLNLSVTSPYNAEVLELMMVPKCIVSPQANRPVIGIVQDSLLGCRKITKRDTFIEKINLIRTAAWHSETEIGHLTPGETHVRIKKGEVITGTFCKKTLGASTGSLIHVTWCFLCCYNIHISTLTFDCRSASFLKN